MNNNEITTRGNQERDTIVYDEGWTPKAERHALDSLSAGDLAALRRIIGEVIAKGYWGNSRTKWDLYAGNFDGYVVPEVEAESQRLRFIETVISKVIATAVPATKG